MLARYDRKSMLRRLCIVVIVGILSASVGAARSSLLREQSIQVPSTAPQAAPVVSTWPNFLGQRRDSVSSETGLLGSFPATGPRERWRRPVGTGYSSPVVTERGLIVLQRVGNEEQVECLDPDSGESRWTFAYPTTYQCQYEYSSGPYSTPSIDGNRVFTVGAQGQLHCLNMTDGELMWRRDLRADYDPAEQLFAMGASPLVDESRLYLPIGGTRGSSGIVAIDKHTGETLWTATEHAAGYASPIKAVIHGREFLFVFNKFGLVALDPLNGRLFWEIPFTSRGVDTVCASSPVVCGDLVLVTMGPAPGALCVRVLPDGSYAEAWRERRVLDSTWNNLVVHDGHIFGFTSKRQRAKLRCIEFATGKQQWEWESDLERGSLLAADGKLIGWGEHGHLALLALNTRELQVLSQTVEPLLKSPCYAMPAIYDGALYVRNEGTLVCFEFRRQPDPR